MFFFRDWVSLRATGSSLYMIIFGWLIPGIVVRGFRNERGAYGVMYLASRCLPRAPSVCLSVGCAFERFVDFSKKQRCGWGSLIQWDVSLSRARGPRRYRRCTNTSHENSCTNFLTRPDQSRRASCGGGGVFHDQRGLIRACVQLAAADPFVSS
jgi:hypothetical protein